MEELSKIPASILIMALSKTFIKSHPEQKELFEKYVREELLRANSSISPEELIQPQPE